MCIKVSEEPLAPFFKTEEKRSKLREGPLPYTISWHWLGQCSSPCPILLLTLLPITQCSPCAVLIWSCRLSASSKLSF